MNITVRRLTKNLQKFYAIFEDSLFVYIEVGTRGKIRPGMLPLRPRNCKLRALMRWALMQINPQLQMPPNNKDPYILMK